MPSERRVFGHAEANPTPVRRKHRQSGELESAATRRRIDAWQDVCGQVRARHVQQGESSRRNSRGGGRMACPNTCWKSQQRTGKVQARHHRSSNQQEEEREQKCLLRSNHARVAIEKKEASTKGTKEQVGTQPTPAHLERHRSLPSTWKRACHECQRCCTWSTRPTNKMWRRIMRALHKESKSFVETSEDVRHHRGRNRDRSSSRSLHHRFEDGTIRSSSSLWSKQRQPHLDKLFEAGSMRAVSDRRAIGQAQAAQSRA